MKARNGVLSILLTLCLLVGLLPLGVLYARADGDDRFQFVEDGFTLTSSENGKNTFVLTYDGVIPEVEYAIYAIPAGGETSLIGLGDHLDSHQVESDTNGDFEYGPFGPEKNQDVDYYIVAGYNGGDFPALTKFATVLANRPDWTFDATTGTLTVHNDDMYMQDFIPEGADDLDAPWKQYQNDILSVVIEDGVKSVGDYAFAGCTKLASVTLPASIVQIGEQAFQGCTGLQTVFLSSGFEDRNAMRDGAFAGCTATVVLPRTLYNSYLAGEQAGYYDENSWGGIASEEQLKVYDGAVTVTGGEVELSGAIWSSGDTAYYAKDAVVKISPTEGHTIKSATSTTAEPVQQEDGSWQFTMGEADVAVTVVVGNSDVPPPPPPSSATLTFEVNGGSAVEVLSLTPGTEVDLSAYTSEKENNVFGGWFAEPELKTPLESITVEQDATVYAKWIPGAVITVPEAAHGAVTADAQIAEADDTVTLTVKPAKGYLLDSITVRDAEKKEVEVTLEEDGTFTFTMPKSAVTVKAVFVAASKRPFTDVPLGKWFYSPVYYCYDNGLFAGTTETTFGPKETMTRAMFATVLYRLAGEPEVTAKSIFTDVPVSKYYAKAVTWAVEKNILAGYGKGLFGAKDPVTREQIVTVLWRYNGRPIVDGVDLSAYKDAGQISSWARSAFEWAISAGIISGKGNGILDPKGQATRAEVATIIQYYDTLNL